VAFAGKTGSAFHTRRTDGAFPRLQYFGWELGALPNPKRRRASTVRQLLDQVKSHRFPPVPKWSCRRTPKCHQGLGAVDPTLVPTANRTRFIG